MDRRRFLRAAAGAATGLSAALAGCSGEPEGLKIIQTLDKANILAVVVEVTVSNATDHAARPVLRTHVELTDRDKEFEEEKQLSVPPNQKQTATFRFKTEKPAEEYEYEVTLVDPGTVTETGTGTG